MKCPFISCCPLHRKAIDEDIEWIKDMCNGNYSSCFIYNSCKDSINKEECVKELYLITAMVIR